MKQFYTLLFTALVCTSSAAQERGPIFTVGACPAGKSLLYAPSDSTGKGTDTIAPDPQDTLTSSRSFFMNAAYYCDTLQGSVEYSHADGLNLVPPHDSGTTVDDTSAHLSSMKFRFGRRFSRPGDTSYAFIYLGGQRAAMRAPHAGSTFTGHGFIAGASAFWSMGVLHDTEFVLAGDLYAGYYPFYDLDFSRALSDFRKVYSFSAGGSFGIGVQYEPWHISVLLQSRTSFDYITFDAAEGVETGRLDLGFYSSTVGIAVVYAIPSGGE